MISSLRSVVPLLSMPLLLALVPAQQPPVQSQGSAGGKLPVVPFMPVPPHEVRPGDPCHTNTDGVKVCNTGDPDEDDQDGVITIDPKTGSETSKTEVKVGNDAHGTVEGIDGNDTVDVSNGAHVEISGTGGIVDLSAGGSSGKITNTAPANGGNITIKGGPVPIFVHPGSTVTFGNGN